MEITLDLVKKWNEKKYEVDAVTERLAVSMNNIIEKFHNKQFAGRVVEVDGIEYNYFSCNSCFYSGNLQDSVELEIFFTIKEKLTKEKEERLKKAKNDFVKTKRKDFDNYKISLWKSFYYEIAYENFINNKININF